MIKKVKPVYPVFAKAAGIQGTVRIAVGIGPTGRIGDVERESGPPSLRKAAEDALMQYVYRPFGDGHTVARTTIEIVFKLPGNVPPPPPPPFSSLQNVKFDETGGYSIVDGHFVPGCTNCIAEPSPQLRQLLAADLEKQVHELEDGEESSSKFLAIEKELGDRRSPLPEGIELTEVPLAKPGTRLYVYRMDLPFAFCGASGNCPMELIAQDASGIRTVLQMGGCALSVYHRAGAPFPDIFTYSHMSVSDGIVDGYSNVAGIWGQLYCGEITSSDNGRKETDDVHVCR
ncbi:MAG: energy transducer TonB [Candidatus Acidiferrales bacterium]